MNKNERDIKANINTMSDEELQQVLDSGESSWELTTMAGAELQRRFLSSGRRASERIEAQSEEEVIGSGGG